MAALVRMMLEVVGRRSNLSTRRRQITCRHPAGFQKNIYSGCG